MDLVTALENKGVDSMFIAGHLMECLEARVYKYDKAGNPVIDSKDLRLKLETIKLLMEMRGDKDKAKGPGKEKDKEFMELFAKQPKKKKK
jgi:hypothetical protein